MKKSFLNSVLGIAVIFITTGCANNWNKDWSTSLQDNTDSHPVVNTMVPAENQKIFFAGYEYQGRKDNNSVGIYGVADLTGKLDWYKKCVDCPNHIIFHNALQDGDNLLLLGVEGKSEKEQKAWIVKVNKEGNVEWLKGFGEKCLNIINDGVVSLAGDYVFLGTFNKDRANETSDAMLLVINKDGDVLKEKMLNKQALNTPRSIIMDNDGNYIVSLNTSKQHKTFLGNGDDYFCFLLGVNRDGDVTWERKLEEEYSYITDLASTQDGGAIVLGGITAHHFTPYSIFVKRVTKQGEDYQGFKKVWYGPNPLINKQYVAGKISSLKAESSYLITARVISIGMIPANPRFHQFMEIVMSDSYLIARMNDMGEIVDEGELGSRYVRDVLAVDKDSFLVSDRGNIEKYSIKPKK